ncbi:type 1 hydrophobin [Laccaria bicolor S238N-H82]|uniref:Hydrophobin n=1 Tax=Laccaria bicolor (strain S238N-H82 / ATCC MYA-4686) TaxID=486041 RepID=B0DP54_LACBS|nr:type 1 hydrophobin [Laccaria bicolor S238N-H82]EDR03555.1 type 1 hydrophobin [Laccaria bicolor S238N-H82]|eukprot:XP_001885703.1 type 1 hydrophobin [Laccaria bicolor S238N-H82]
MFSKVLFVAAALVSFVAASPVPDIENSCNTGSMQCCNQTFASDSKQANVLASLLNINLSQFTGQVGTSCTPISALAISQGGSCTQQPVCCDGNTFHGLIVVGCSPINVNL